MTNKSCHDVLSSFLSRKLKTQFDVRYPEEQIFSYAKDLLSNKLVESVSCDCMISDICEAINNEKTPIVLVHRRVLKGDRYVDKHEYLIIRNYFTQSSSFECIDPRSRLHFRMTYGEMLKTWFFVQNPENRINRVMYTTKRIYQRY